MSSATQSTTKVQLCSLISAANGESTFGTASHTKRRVLVELPLPWKKPALDSPGAPAGLASLVRSLQNEGINPTISMFAPDETWSVDGHTRILEYRLPEAPFTTYTQREYLLPTDKVAELIEPFLRNKDSDSLEEFRQETVTGRRDYLVCTHGAHDACCGKFGYPIYKMLRMMAENPQNNVRVWRSSHLGGHRFAPTMVEMPSGRYWGHLEARELGPIVRRELPRELIRKRYRGWAALPSGAAQWAECELFARAGWDWTHALVTPGEASQSLKNQLVEEPQTMSFAFTHTDHGIDGSVEVVVTPNGYVSTVDSSSTEIDLREAQQFVATITNTDVRDFFT